MTIRDRIIESSAALFAAHGLRSVRMDDIAATLGISKRTLYESFGDKEHLIEACIRYFFDRKMAEDCLRCAEADNVIEELLLSMSSQEESVKRGFRLMNDLRKFYPAIHQRIAEESMEVGTRQMKEKLQRGIEQGLILPSTEVDQATRLFIDFMQAIFVRLNALPDASGNSAARILRRCVILFARGVATQRGIAMIDDYASRNPEINLI